MSRRPSRLPRRRATFLLAGLLAATGVQAATVGPSAPTLDAAAAGRFAALALGCVQLEYPNKLSHVLASDADVRPPRALAPAFFGCYDWHSSVHGHWLLARVARLFPDAPYAASARAALERSLTPANIAVEVDYLRTPGRASFERPYGLAWLLTLARELREWDDPDARRWAAALAPLEAEAATRLATWLPKLGNPVRIGEHNQTAFSLGLVLDWAAVAGRKDMTDLATASARRFYLGDTQCPLAYEPSGEDFLSPCIAEADLMRRVLPAAEYARWLGRFLPMIPGREATDWLPPGVVTDRADPKLAHLDGLNLSRAWMLEGIAAGLPGRDRRIPALLATARVHCDAALPAVTGEHYEGGHWLGTFAVYLTSRAGVH